MIQSANAVLAALLQRFRAGPDVGEDYRDTGDIRRLVCRVDAMHEGARLIETALEQMRAWHLRSVGAGWHDVRAA